MRLKSKRLISLLLAGSMMVSMLPASAVTAFAETTANNSVTSEAAQNVAVTVDSFTTGNLEEAVKAKHANLDEITSLTVRGGILNQADFQFLSGVVVSEGTKGDGRYASNYTPNTIPCLKNLQTLDLTDAVGVFTEANGTTVYNVIPPRAFQGNKTIQKILLPKNLVRTYLHAFSKMTALEYLGTNAGNLHFPDSMETMGEGMLWSDNKGDNPLSAELVLPPNLKDIGAACFYNSGVKGAVSIPGSVNIETNTDISNGKFQKSGSIFYGTDITSLTFGDGIEYIGDNFAKDCKHLTSVTIPSSVKSIGECAFQSTALTQYPAMDGVTTVGRLAFADVKTFTNDIVLSENVSYGNGVFQNIQTTGGIVFHSNSVGMNVLQNAKFNGDLKLGADTVPASIIARNDTDYDGKKVITGNVILEPGVKTIESSAFNAAGLTGTLILPDGLETIGGSAFRHNQFSGTIVIPESVKKIGAAAFSFVGGGASTSAKAEAQTSERKVDTIIVENPDISLEQYAFANQKTGVKIYFTSDVQNTNSYWYNPECIILNTDGGTIATDGNGNVTAEPDTTTGLYTPTKDGYKFVGWYNGDTKLTGAAEAGQTYTAKWTPYNTKVDADVKANADPASKTVEITVNVEANLTELDGATATLNFTDANGNDDSANVTEVKVNGKTFNKNADGSYTAKLNTLMQNASENGAEAVMLAGVNEEAVVPSTVKGTARLTVTYKTPGKHNVGIVLNAANGDVICKEIATVEIAPEPGTLNLTGCTATLKDGTPVENGAKVPVGAEVTVTFEPDADSDLVLNGWNVTPETLTDTNGKLVKDITADTFTFKMPETDEGVTIAAQTKTKAAAPAEDDSLDAATVVTGVVLGTGTAILAYHIGTEVYAEQVLGKGVAIPRTREEVAFKAWELAGKPAVELNGEPLSEAAQAEKWAVESGLMQNVDGSFNGSKKMSKLKALRTLDAAKKLG